MMEVSHQPEIIYDDPDLLIINKPAGLLSIPDGYNPTLPYLKSMLESKFGPLWLVHRLDKETSGVMVLARNPEVHRVLNQLFRDHNVSKTYHGLATPPPEWQENVFDHPLKVNADRKHRTRVDFQDGKTAWTSCRVLTRASQAVLLEITIRTGVTHQIRAHLRENGMTLIGETLYNAGLSTPPITAPRIMLHAREISFRHPISGAPQIFTAPYPEDFREVYTTIRATKGPDAMI